MPEISHRVLFKPVPNATTEGCHMDVYLPKETENSPIAIMIHGGGWCTGASTDIPPEQVDLLLSHNITVISIEYRLAPHVLMPDIREDLVDAYVFVQEKLNEVLGLKLAVRKCVLMGWSAGASAALFMDHDIPLSHPHLPRPLGLIPTYPLVNPNTSFSSPISAYTDRLSALTQSQREFVESVHEEKISCAVAQHDFGGWPDCPGAVTPRDLWCKHMMLSGALSSYLYGHSPPFTPNETLLSLVSPSHSPTFVVCATSDTLIPPQQSRDYHAALVAAGVECVLGEAWGMGHGITEKTVKKWPKEQDWWEDAIGPSLDWAVKKLKG